MSALWFALEIVAAVRVRDPRQGRDGAVVETIGWMLAQRDDDRLRLRSCAVETTSAMGTETIYPASFIAASPESVAPLQVADDRLIAGPWLTEFGNADDDRDGHPGVTIHVRNHLLGRGEVYITQRSMTSLDGRFHADGSATGRASVAADPTVLDASTWWLKIPTHPRPDHDRSRFRLVPIPEASCDAVARALRSATPRR
jgi:hypothetical protein